MYRVSVEKLFQWKQSPYRNPLVIEGALTEQYVCQQLKTIQDLDIYYTITPTTEAPVRLTLLLIRGKQSFPLRQRLW